MSLIEEALRRLQDPSLPTTKQALPPAPPAKQGGTAKPAAAPPTPHTPPPQPVPIHPWSTVASPTPVSTPAPRTTSVLIALVATVLVLTIALLVGGVWWLGHTLSGGTRPVTSRQAVERSPTVAREAGLSQPTTTAQEPSHAPQTPPVQGPPGVQETRPVPEPPGVQETRPVPVASDQAAPPTPEDHFVLSGLVEGEGEPYAVINGAIVAVGDRLGEFTLIDITKGAARLRRADGAETVLRVPR